LQPTGHPEQPTAAESPALPQEAGGEDDEPARSCCTPGVAIDICDPNANLSAPQRRTLGQRLGRTLAAACEARTGAPARGEVRLRVVNDTEMADAHQRYAGVKGTTDVLTFDLSEHDEPGTLDLDAYICFDEAQRQAGQRGHDAPAELLLYALHACLHCLGYDDRDEAAFRRMHAEEDRLLQAAGLPALFRLDSTERHDGTQQTPNQTAKGNPS